MAILINLSAIVAHSQNAGQPPQPQAPPAPAPPITPPIVLGTPKLSSTPRSQNVYYHLVFDRQMAENPPPPGLRSGKQHHAGLINMIKILELEAYFPVWRFRYKADGKAKA